MVVISFIIQALVRLTWIVFVMRGRWPYSWCLMGCCRQDMFNIAQPNMFAKSKVSFIQYIQPCWP